MKEGYYWIQHVGIVQVAYYTNDTVDDLETGKTITGVWHLTRGDDICYNGEAEVLQGRCNRRDKKQKSNPWLWPGIFIFRLLIVIQLKTA